MIVRPGGGHRSAGGRRGRAGSRRGVDRLRGRIQRADRGGRAQRDRDDDGDRDPPQHRCWNVPTAARETRTLGSLGRTPVVDPRRRGATAMGFLDKVKDTANKAAEQVQKARRDRAGQARGVEAQEEDRRPEGRAGRRSSTGSARARSRPATRRSPASWARSQATEAELAELKADAERGARDGDAGPAARQPPWPPFARPSTSTPRPTRSGRTVRDPLAVTRVLRRPRQRRDGGQRPQHQDGRHHHRRGDRHGRRRPPALPVHDHRDADPGRVPPLDDRRARPTATAR